MISPTMLCDGAQMAIFGDFFASCIFSDCETRAARLDLNLKFALSHTMCASMADMHSATAEIRRGKKKELECGTEQKRIAKKLKPTRMWANAQRDGRPAEHRWRPLFSAAKFGQRPLLDAVQ